MAVKVDPLYDKKHECLFCGRQFTNKWLRTSQTRQVRRDSDLCGHFSGENPYFYEVAVCPHCGYAFANTFQPAKKEQRSAIQASYTGRIARKDFTGPRTLADALHAYKLALLCGELNGEKRSVLAPLALRVAWFCRYGQDAEQERKYLRLACDAYREVYEKEKGPGGANPNLIIYLIGELEGRLGNIAEACKWLGMLAQNHTLEPFLRQMLLDRWAHYRQELNRASQA